MSDAAPPPRRPLWIRLAPALLLALSLSASTLVLYLDGRLPASVPEGAPSDDARPLMTALQHVDSRGLLDLDALERDRAPLDAYVASLARTSPRSAPQAFPTAEHRLAFWLNAYHSLVLQALVDDWPRLRRDEKATFTPPLFRSWPVGGERLTLTAIERRYLAQAQDARVHLARFEGHRGGALLEGVPFSAETLEGQLNDAARRFLRRREVVSIKAGAVTLSPLLKEHEQDFLAALPEGRKHLLQVVWAFLPEACDGERPGCDTRADLDKACGARLDACTIAWAADDSAVPAVGRR